MESNGAVHQNYGDKYIMDIYAKCAVCGERKILAYAYEEPERVCHDCKDSTS